MPRVKYDDMVQFEHEIVENHKLFDGIELERLKSYIGMDTEPAWEFKTPMAHGFYKSYVMKGSDKIEKICVGELHYMRRAKYCIVNMTASDDYDLPIFACEYDETAPRVGVTTDYLPLVDVGAHPEYREKYLDPLAAFWRKYRTTPGLSQEGRCLVQRRYAAWPWARESLSPYTLDGHIPEPEHRLGILDSVAEYGRIWLDMLDKAEPMKDPEYKQEVLTRKKAMQKYYRDLDPGGEVIKKIFGDEKHKLFVSLVF